MVYDIDLRPRVHDRKLVNLLWDWHWDTSRAAWFPSQWALTHWGRVTHICISKLTIIGSDNGLSPGRRQAIICTNDGILLIGALGTNFSEILIEIQTFSPWKNRLKVSSAKWQPFCLGLNELMWKLFPSYDIIMVEAHFNEAVLQPYGHYITPITGCVAN